MRRRLLKHLLSATLTLSVSSPLALSKSQADGTEHPPNIRTNVRQVLVPVVVVDKKGHYVTDLKPSDFQVFEDGSPETIVAFSTNNVDAASASAKPGTQQPNGSKTAAPAPAQSEPVRRTYLIILDTLHSSFSNFVRVRKALEKFFEQEPDGDSQYALMALGRQIQIVQDSTRDPALVLNKLRDKQAQKTIQESESSNTAFEAGRFTELVSAYCAACGCVTIPVVPEQAPWCAMRQTAVQSFLKRYGERTFLLNEDFLQQLKRLVDAAASMPTARTIIFISDGFNRFPGQELYGILQGFGPNTSSFSFNPRDTQPELDSILKVAVRYDVKFYTIDSRGLYTTASFAGSSLDVSHCGVTPSSVDRQTVSIAIQNTDALAQLARETGGLFFENNNDILKGIRRAFADGREAYVLAYVPKDKPFDGKYRKIRVKVKEKGLSVNAKPGYWATN